MTDPGGIVWMPGKVRVTGFTTAGKREVTSVRVELTTTDPWELSDLIRQLAVLRDLPEAKKGRANPAGAECSTGHQAGERA